MNEVGWPPLLISIIVGANVLTLAFANHFARRMNREQETNVQMLKVKNESMTEQLVDLKQENYYLKKEFSGIKEKLEKLDQNHQRVEEFIEEFDKVKEAHDRLHSSQARKITSLQKSISGMVDSVNEFELESLKADLHLAQLAIRAGRHQMEGITRSLEQDQGKLPEAELKIPEQRLVRQPINRTESKSRSRRTSMNTQ